MPNKALRILIADAQHVQRVGLEKILNRQGYYRIAPVSSLEELLILTEYAVKPFDLLLINQLLLGSPEVDPGMFSHSHPSIRNALIYDGTNGHSPPLSGCWLAHWIQVTLPHVPNEQSIKNFMGFIDPVSSVDSPGL